MRGRRLSDADMGQARVWLKNLKRPFSGGDCYEASLAVMGARYHGAAIFARLQRDGWLEVAGPHPKRKGANGYRLRSRPEICGECGRGKLPTVVTTEAAR